MESPGITLCMIARDEADCIGDAIRSCRGVVDDIVVVDTGSADGTPELAKSLGARVFHQAWEDSFSKPRNLGLEQVKTPWVLVLDCDEKLQADSHAPLVEFCRTTEAHAGMVHLHVHTEAGVSPSRRPRVGRGDKGYRFHYRLHERIHPVFESVADTNIIIEHYGYITKPREAKEKLYSRLQQLELRERPNDNYLLIEIMQTLQKKGDARWKEYLPRAVATLKRDAEKPPHALVEVLLDAVLRLPDEEVPAALPQAQAAQLSEKWLGKSIPLLLARAEWNLRNQRFKRAKQLATRALQLWNTKTFQPCVPFKPALAVQNLQTIVRTANQRLVQ
jgi:hypothetical protein